jgi:hypothetical protein
MKIAMAPSMIHLVNPIIGPATRGIQCSTYGFRSGTFLFFVVLFSLAAKKEQQMYWQVPAAAGRAAF